jgi:hypothetical protein
MNNYKTSHWKSQWKDESRKGIEEKLREELMEAYRKTMVVYRAQEINDYVTKYQQERMCERE